MMDRRHAPANLSLSSSARLVVFITALAVSMPPIILLMRQVNQAEDALVLLMPVLAFSGLLAAAVVTAVVHLLLHQRLLLFLRRMVVNGAVGGLVVGALGFPIVVGLAGLLRRAGLLIPEPGTIALLASSVLLAGAVTFAARKGYPVETPLPSRVAVNVSAGGLTAVVVIASVLVIAPLASDLFP